MRTPTARLLLASLLLPLPIWATAANETAIAEEIDSALIRLADRDAFDGAGAAIRRDARVRYELGAVVDVRSPAPNGLPVLSVTPGGAAERIGLRLGDRLLGVNGTRVATSKSAGKELPALVAASRGKLALEIARSNRRIELTGQADRIVLPAYSLTIGSTASARAASAPGCGRVSAFDAMPRGRQLFPALIIAIDGRLPTTPSGSMRVPAGRHRITLAEAIDSDRFTAIQLKQRDGSGPNRYKTLDLDVVANTTYLVAAKFVDPSKLNLRDGGYWEPVVLRSTSEACR